VVLHGDTTFTLRQQKYKVSDALKTGEATALFGALICPVFIAVPYFFSQTIWLIRWMLS
jgi:hypothetical protein